VRLTTQVNNLSSSLLKTVSSVLWDTNNDWPVCKNEAHFPSVDLLQLLQEIVDQSAWCGGNALSFVD